MAGMDIDLLMEPTNLFPGTISPKLEVSTKTTVEETFFDLQSDSSRTTLVKSKPTISRPPHQKGFPRRVCHSVAFSRAQKNIPLKRKARPPFKYSKVSDDLILRTNPNIVLGGDQSDADKASTISHCYCASKKSKSANSQMIGNWLAQTYQEGRGKVHSKTDNHKETCSLCTMYDGYFISNCPKPKSSRHSWVTSRSKPPKLCWYCKQNYSETYPTSAFKNGSSCKSDVSDSSRKRVCFCSPTEKASTLAQRLHDKLSKTLDTNSRLFQRCIDFDDC
nr:uncharacterized protein LOC111507214 [Leptinotarsa decemlineata]